MQQQQNAGTKGHFVLNFIEIEKVFEIAVT
jgi:hypothetical protein